ncbi:predicted protein [Histoplasma capsulatum G186AR]|uniref:Uncharacterized protein n=1 Tax=Ajellomyces capsulatus (strain G186AR / H82 / ATCC MYA-2454 / RMSCC 2432) TaxID=447093 RepID=C0NRG8_AJECG|nr:uncharacterized protein HCBG_05598 [Histoplasma capsulatum G186AR]EEH06282.1 predicted protein [Histoplasma capsulatum G186AR]
MSYNPPVRSQRGGELTGSTKTTASRISLAMRKHGGPVGHLSGYQSASQLLADLTLQSRFETSYNNPGYLYANNSTSIELLSIYYVCIGNSNSVEEKSSLGHRQLADVRKSPTSGGQVQSSPYKTPAYEGVSGNLLAASSCSQNAPINTGRNTGHLLGQT